MLTHRQGYFFLTGPSPLSRATRPAIGLTGNMIRKSRTVARQDLYTILAEYGGGTYISQVEADAPDAAIEIWTQSEPSGKDDLPFEARQDLRKELTDGEVPIPLAGQKNVWCITGLYRNRLLLINIVLTSTRSTK